MKFPAFIFKIRDETGRHEEELIDFEVVIKSKTHHKKQEFPIKDITIDRELKKIIFWID